MWLASSGTLMTMTGMYATHSNLKRPEACLGGADSVQAQLYCFTPEVFGHPFAITPLEANLPIELFTPDTRITTLLEEAQAAAAESADTDVRKNLIRSIEPGHILGLAASQHCSFQTDGFVHGMERIIRPVIFSVGPCEPVHKKDPTRNSDAPWMSFVSIVDDNNPIMVGTMPLTYQETQDLRLEIAVPAFLKAKKPLLGYKRRAVPYYMGAHVLRTPAEGGVDHQVLERVLMRKTLVGQTLGQLLRYSV
jgi:hypothetical protein